MSSQASPETFGRYAPGILIEDEGRPVIFVPAPAQQVAFPRLLPFRDPRLTIQTKSGAAEYKMHRVSNDMSTPEFRSQGVVLRKIRRGNYHRWMLDYRQVEFERP